MSIKTANWQFDIGGLDKLKINQINPLKFRKQVIYAGNHVKGENDEFVVDEAMIDHWVETGNRMLADQVDIPWPKKHQEDDPELNRAFTEKLVKGVDGKGRPSLYAHGRFTDEEAKKLQNRSNVSLFSPAKRAIGGKVYERPITHFAFTNYPVIKGLEPFTNLTLSYDDPAPKDQTCQECQRRQDRVFRLHEVNDIDTAGKELAGKVGKAYAVLSGDNVLVCAEVPEDGEAFFTFTG